MLVKFSVKNYRGFSDKIEWNLSNPEKYDFNTFAISNGIIKNGIVYGPNGAGKSNFALALFDIENHLSQKWKKIDYYVNYVYAGNKNCVVDFEYVFLFDKYLMEYSYSKNYQGVLISEKLVVNTNLIFSTENDFFINEVLFPTNPSVKENLKNNANKISIINYLLNFYPLPDDHYLIRLQKFVNSMLWFKCLDSREFIGLDDRSDVILDEFIIKNGLANDFALFLKNVSGQEFHFVNDNNDKFLQCNIDGNKISFNNIASTGTQSLKLLYYWLRKMLNGASFVFIDEFDAFYHFRLSFEVCRELFKLDTQVFLTSHNTYLMTNSLLRPDCNFIIDGRQIKPLCACTQKDLQFGHNIEKLFRGNAFKI